MLFLRGLEKKYARSRSSSRDTPFHAANTFHCVTNPSLFPPSRPPSRFKNFLEISTIFSLSLSPPRRNETKRNETIAMAKRSRNDLHCYFLGEINSLVNGVIPAKAESWKRRKSVSNRRESSIEYSYIIVLPICNLSRLLFNVDRKSLI